MKIFLDTNAILDVILERNDVDSVRKLIEYSKTDIHTRLYVSYLTIANSAYVLRKRASGEIKSELADLLKHLNVISSGDIQILQALKCGSPDFEDALQIACAEEKDCDVIITRNPLHFIDYTEIPVISPQEFVARCGVTSAAAGPDSRREQEGGL